MERQVSEHNPHEPTSADIIILIHKATLELYGIKIDPAKSPELSALITEVAEGKRTFVESGYEQFGSMFGAKRDKSEVGVPYAQIVRGNRTRERNAARLLSGLPPVSG
jgi:hypothetical protein